MFAPDIADALSMAGKAYILPVYSAGEKQCPHSSSDEVVRLSNGRIKSVSFDDAVEILSLELKPGDIFLTMGAGDVYKAGEKFLNLNEV